MTKHTPEPYFIEDQGEIKAVCGPTLHTLVMRDMTSAGALRDALNAAYAKGQRDALANIPDPAEFVVRAKRMEAWNKAAANLLATLKLQRPSSEFAAARASQLLDDLSALNPGGAA